MAVDREDDSGTLERRLRRLHSPGRTDPVHSDHRCLLVYVDLTGQPVGHRAQVRRRLDHDRARCVKSAGEVRRPEHVFDVRSIEPGRRLAQCLEMGEVVPVVPLALLRHRHIELAARIEDGAVHAELLCGASCQVEGSAIHRRLAPVMFDRPGVVVGPEVVR